MYGRPLLNLVLLGVESVLTIRHPHYSPLLRSSFVYPPIYAPSVPPAPLCRPPIGNRFKADVGDDVTKGSAFVVTGRGPGLEQGTKQLTSCDQLTSGMEGEMNG